MKKFLRISAVFVLFSILLPATVVYFPKVYAYFSGVFRLFSGRG